MRVQLAILLCVVTHLATDHAVCQGTLLSKQYVAATKDDQNLVVDLKLKGFLGGWATSLASALEDTVQRSHAVILKQAPWIKHRINESGEPLPTNLTMTLCKEGSPAQYHIEYELDEQSLESNQPVGGDSYRLSVKAHELATAMQRAILQNLKTPLLSTATGPDVYQKLRSTVVIANAVVISGEKCALPLSFAQLGADRLGEEDRNRLCRFAVTWEPTDSALMGNANLENRHEWLASEFRFLRKGDLVDTDEEIKTRYVSQRCIYGKVGTLKDSESLRLKLPDGKLNGPEVSGVKVRFAPPIKRRSSADEEKQVGADELELPSDTNSPAIPRQANE